MIARRLIGWFSWILKGSEVLLRVLGCSSGCRRLIGCFGVLGCNGCFFMELMVARRFLVVAKDFLYVLVVAKRLIHCFGWLVGCSEWLLRVLGWILWN